MGEMSDKVIDAAKETASDALESGKQIAPDAATRKSRGGSSPRAFRTARSNPQLALAEPHRGPEGPKRNISVASFASRRGGPLAGPPR